MEGQLKKGLIIVESPAKARTIQKFLPSTSFTVKASMGHIKDLPKSQMGIEIDKGFIPKYIVIKGKTKIIKELKSAGKEFETIYLAPDPDREGEAIAWHISQIMDNTDIKRIELHEITKTAVTNALNNPRNIDMNKVDAQQARRVLDRLVGYNLSPLLWKKIRKGLSAGRVQSVAVKLICDRETEYQAFKPQEYWTITALLSKVNETETFEALLIKENDKKVDLPNKIKALAIAKKLEKLDFTVNDVSVKVQKKSPPPPFITSTLQQDASRKLNFSATKTMQIAQQLYEGLDIDGEGTIGLITYMRTDSFRTSEEAKKVAIDYIKENFGPDYVGQPRKFKARIGAQEAHEAIRPTTIHLSPDIIKKNLTNDQYRLYKLIWKRFLISLMSPAQYKVLNIEIKAGDYLLKATGSNLTFKGYLAILDDEEKKQNGESEDKEKEGEIPFGNLPELQKKQPLTSHKIDPKQHFTQPPPRFSEASLIKALEEKGIGRPSTYATIVSTILKREYVIIELKRFIPTELGFVVTNLLTENFPEIVNVDFTANLEEKLDFIEDGKLNWVKTISDFYSPFNDKLKTAETSVEKIALTPQYTGEKCEKCGKDMLIKTGRFGKFAACSGYPDCKSTKPIKKELGINCPEVGCTGKVVERQSKKGKFYGCDKYPECKFSSWGMPTNSKCNTCGKIMVLKFGKSGKKYLSCIDQQCKGKGVKEPKEKEQAMTV